MGRVNSGIDSVQHAEPAPRRRALCVPERASCPPAGGDTHSVLAAGEEAQDGRAAAERAGHHHGQQPEGGALCVLEVSPPGGSKDWSSVSWPRQPIKGAFMLTAWLLIRNPPNINFLRPSISALLCDPVSLHMWQQHLILCLELRFWPVLPPALVCLAKVTLKGPVPPRPRGRG